MARRVTLFLALFLITVTVVMAQENKANGKGNVAVNTSDAKEMSGMSIVGNDEAPKSLTIVPWKSSDIGAETPLQSMLDESETPIDRDVFKRQIEFYYISTAD